ncbi:hypothetical protein L1K06_09415, partial [Bifidobacterium bifidum]|uniref:hypothetical protein n=1 Tax=Bifidobacterium bifidum TaxID=1681 RepID=UPI00242D1842
AHILGRFEAAALERPRELQSGASPDAYSELGGAESAEAFRRTCPNISWVGHLTTNPAYGTQVGDANYEIIARGASEQGEEYDLDIHLDTYGDNDPDGGVSK